jgi:hypothetical protein
VDIEALAHSYFPASVHTYQAASHQKEQTMFTMFTVFLFLVLIVPLGMAAQRLLFKEEGLACDPEWELSQQRYD